MKKTQRAQVAKETLRLLEDGTYINSLNQVVDIRDWMTLALSQSAWFTPDALNGLLDEITLASDTTQFEITSETTLQACERLAVHEEHSAIGCLNFASAKNPGGGFLGGSQAQEESLARSSGLYPTQTRHSGFYQNHRGMSCLYSHNMLYSPAVPVIRNDDGHLLDVPYRVDFLTSPAVNKGCLKQHKDRHGLEQLAQVMHERTERVLALFAHKQCSVLVLGAWGCGVFRNDPTEIASYFADHLLKGKFAGHFEKVVFAIKDQPDSKTYQAFDSAFSQK